MIILRLALLLSHLFLALTGSFLSFIVILRWLRHMDFLHSVCSSLHIPLDSLDCFRENTFFLTLCFIVSISLFLTALLGIYSVTLTRRRLIVLLAVILLACQLIAFPMVTGVITSNIPSLSSSSFEFYRHSADQIWEGWSVDDRLSYERAHQCCGFSNYTDRPVYDLQTCFAPDSHSSIPKGVPSCQQYLMADERSKFMPVYLVAFLPVAVIIFALVLSVLLFRKYRLAEKVEMERRALRAIFVQENDSSTGSNSLLPNNSANSNSSSGSKKKTKKKKNDEDQDLERWAKYNG